MGVGISVFLMAVGAILAFAIDVDSTNGFNINTIGWILMAAGLIGVITALAIFGPRRRAGVVEERTELY